MSNRDSRRPPGEEVGSDAFGRLESAARSLVDRLQAIRGELASARDAGQEMEELLRRFTGGEEDPGRLLSRLHALEAQNRELLERLAKGRASVERMLARIRFLEEQS